MVSRGASKIFPQVHVTVDPDLESSPDVSVNNDTFSRRLADTLSDRLFRKDCLDRKLERHHITGIPLSWSLLTFYTDDTKGIAFSGAVGIGIYQTSGEIIALGGPVGAFLSYIFAGLVIFSVMRCLAEMVSVRPVKGPLMDFPHTFVDEGLGFSVGVMYWWGAIDLFATRTDCMSRLCNCMSTVTLTIAAAMFTQYWDSSFSMTSAIFVLLLAIFFMNACGVQVFREQPLPYCRI